MPHCFQKAVKYLFCTSLLSLLLAGSAFSADLATDVGAVTATSLRLRSAPTTASQTIAYLDHGTAIAISGKNDNWFQVAYAGQAGYVSSDYIIVDQDGLFETSGYVTHCVNIRSQATTQSNVSGTLNKGTYFTVTGFKNGWYKVLCRYGTVGYIRSDFVQLTNSIQNSKEGSAILSKAKKYLGVPYVYGGASSSGFDCSGLTMFLYNQMGYYFPHTATGQWQSSIGKPIYSISALQEGDLVFFCDPRRSLGKACSHCGLYVGGGKFIHASSSQGRVLYSSLSSGYYNRYFVGGKHVF